jgi:hypothetical protein
VSNVRGNLLGRFAPCRAPHARVALRQPAGDACGDRDGSLDVQEVTEVRHDLERVNLAERQRERGAGQPLMRCVHKSDQLQVEPVGHG